MANTKKFVAKNGLHTQNVDFVSPNEANTITVTMLDSDTLSVSGNSGQLFSITDSLTGTIFAVNDISGVPSIEVDDDGTIRFAETFGNVLIGTSTDDGVNKLQVAGNISVTGTVDGRDLSVDGAKLDGIAAGAEVNQNAFSNVVVSGQTTVAADSKTDTLTLIAGTNVTITTDAVNDSITISANDTSVDWSEVQNKPDPVVTVTLTGDVTGSGNTTLTDLTSGTISFATTIAANSVALGTDTTGNYVAGLTAGTGIAVTGTAGEGWSPTVALASAGTAGTYTKVTTDAYGRVTSGTTLAASDIPALDASKITSGTIDAARLPSYVDDVLEFTNLASFPSTGEAGKIYIALDTNKTYRWGGSSYVYITSGAVDSVAGKTGVVTLTNADVGLGNVENKSSATIRGEITSTNVTSALGFTPYNSTNPNGYTSNTGTVTSVSGTGTASGLTLSGTVTSTGSLTLSGTVNALAAGTYGISVSGNAATATKLQTARTITLGGDLSGSASFDGSANITISAQVADDSHTHDSRYPVLDVERTLSVTAANWVTIAQAGTARAWGEFYVWDNDSSRHNMVKILASTAYGQNVVTTLNGNRYGIRTIAHVRILYNTADRTYGGAKLQVYCENPTFTLHVRALLASQINGWSSWNVITPVAEGTPSGWAEDSTTRFDDITNPNYSIVGSYLGSGAGLTNLNASNLASGTIPNARLSGTYTGISITGNAATATKLATARSISLAGDVTGSASFDGSSNISITATVADNSHSHAISDVSGLQAALDGKSATGHTHNGGSLPQRSDWVSRGALLATVGQLAWRNYSNGHTIFDASASLTPTDAVCNNTNPDVAWTPSYPTLMGYNGTNTYGVRVDRSRYAEALTSNITINGVGANVGSSITVYDSTKLPLSGGTLSGMLYSASLNGAMVQNNSAASFEVRNSSGSTGDYGMAMINFHCQGHYAMKIGCRADGYFGIGGWSSAAWRWYSASDGTMVASGNVVAYSDPRLKEDFKRIERPMDILDKLDGGTFVWKHGIKHTEVKAGKRDYGVLADQVEAVMPEIVSGSIEIDGETYRTVAYEKLVPVLIEAVKELKAEVDALRTMVGAQG